MIVDDHDASAHHIRTVPRGSVKTVRLAVPPMALGTASRTVVGRETDSQDAG